METNRLTVASAAANPETITQNIVLADGEIVCYRPLLPEDVDGLTEFLNSLSTETRFFWDLSSYDRAKAQELCDAINRYDKFRMVATQTGAESGVLLALFEFSMDLGSEAERYGTYGITLEPETTCRFGPCIRDSYQHRGLGSALMPATLEIARRFGKNCVVLWGGVLQENARAIHFYQKHGFQTVGAFHEPSGIPCLDMMRFL